MYYADYHTHSRLSPDSDAPLLDMAEAAARAGLRQPAATLREEDFVCFSANWQPKDANLAAMAQQLNLLPESFVFLDDNPAERALVRQSLPGTAVPELAAPEGYVRTLDRAGYFEAVGLSADDKKRAQMYHENALRSAASASFSEQETSSARMASFKL